MTVHQPVHPEWSLEAENELFEMANLYPRDTGLPMTVWVSPRGNARHDVRVKVCRPHGDRMIVEDTAVVGVRPEPRVIEGPLATADFHRVAAWIRLNEAALVGYWDGDLSTGQFVRALQTV
ncbi:hypothetical protein BZG35_12705 [Brevundimonas sp. LM2]|uniref:hypothetical protein n=1 Tax=Brevundimonas sp. LM2 TaxID=1938605 RepID=UPI000983EE88|nr:hypothetical protein [Brevundimonas sp. LM2]AQR62405.1 hypothetical protein BZG35_12705 [Brevundimonas sp. LM2]